MKQTVSHNIVDREKYQAPFLVLSLLLVIGLGSSVVPASWFGVKKEVKKYPTMNLSSLAFMDGEQDINGDGTLTWKEYVAKNLDLPTNADSADLQPDPQGLAIVNDPNNLTSSFTKNMFLAVTTMQKNGIADEASLQSVSNELTYAEIKKLEPRVYTRGDIKVVSDSKIALKKYGNDMSTILKDFITKDIIIRDYSALRYYLETADEGQLIPLIKDADNANKVLTKLITVQVPQSAVEEHLNALNMVDVYRESLYGMSVVNTDALRTEVAFNKYPNSITNVLRIGVRLSNFFDTQNIVFQSSEPGYDYTIGYTSTIQ